MKSGAPCVPGEELNPASDGFVYQELSFGSGVPQSGAPTCLVYHFQGLVTCPYGQDAAGQAPAGASPCMTADGRAVVGMVEPQCVNRQATNVVIGSCRCANEEGQTSDGDTYWTCPSGLACTLSISSIGASEADYAGAYCVPPVAVFDGGPVCTATCDPVTAPCP